MNTINDETLPKYLEKFRAAGVQRVFICGLRTIYTDSSLLNEDEDRVRRAVRFFQGAGIETGIWVSAFGHGSAPMGIDGFARDMYTPVTGIHGDISAHGFCPRDPRFAADYASGVRRIATLSPDLIFLDDDFRFNLRSYYMGCFCPLHLKEYYERIGEVIPREDLEKLMWTGGKNKYRTEYMKLMGDSLIDFAKKLRSEVDEVDPTIRMGFACVSEHWDMCGVDPGDIAKAFAGNTRPFLRTFGAPYHNTNIVNIIETTRSQFAWNEGTGVEIFAEGDTCPRYRNQERSSSRVLELFDFALRANGDGDGILAYLFHYINKPEYEPEYADRYARNLPIQRGIEEIFAGKEPVGVEVIHTQHTAENADLPSELETDSTFESVMCAFYSPAAEFLSPISIPTAYRPVDYPLMIMGEYAKYVDLGELKKGALIDVGAAKILQARGVDVGLVSAEARRAREEFFPRWNDRVVNIENSSLRRVTCSQNAEVLSYYRPDDSPAVYRYENADGERFVVMAFEKNSVKHQVNENFSSNYYRQAQIIEGLEWAGRKKMPAVCLKNPNLYMLTSAGESGMAVAMLNIHLDSAFAPEVRLDKEYSSIRFVSGSGRLEGDKVILDDIPAYGFAAFEVR